jgi:hypothetical protein
MVCPRSPLERIVRLLLPRPMMRSLKPRKSQPVPPLPSMTSGANPKPCACRDRNPTRSDMQELSPQHAGTDTHQARHEANGDERCCEPLPARSDKQSAIAKARSAMLKKTAAKNLPQQPNDALSGCGPKEHQETRWCVPAVRLNAQLDRGRSAKHARHGPTTKGQRSQRQP